MWIVRLALRRPYTFVVMGLAILLLGISAIVTTPTDIFPEIDIPVISVIWNYDGLTTEDMASRITTFSEYTISSAVSDVRRDGTVHYLGVQLGRDLGQSVEIEAGLSGSERLVVSPPDGLKEGMRVAAEETKRN